MFVYLLAAMVLGTLICVAGIGLMVRSLVSASRRGQPLAWRFWAPAESFLAKELSDNRRGFWLSLAGLVILGASVLMMARSTLPSGNPGPPSTQAMPSR